MPEAIGEGAANRHRWAQYLQGQWMPGNAAYRAAASPSSDVEWRGRIMVSGLGQRPAPTSGKHRQAACPARQLKLGECTIADGRPGVLECEDPAPHLH
jgi:hypothetical protein